MVRSAVLALACAAAMLVACGDPEIVLRPPEASGTGGAGASTGSGKGGDIGLGGSTGSMGQQVQSLEFDPPATTLTLDGKTPQTATFSLKATYTGGATEIVAAEALQFDRPDLAALVAGPPVELTAPGEYAGVGTLHGIFAGMEATATLTVVVNVKEIDPGVDPTIVTALDGPGLGQDPSVSSLLYPYDATVFPQGLASPLVMWTAPASGDVYRLHYEQDNYTFDGYWPVTVPASVRAPQNLWDKMLASNPGGPIKVELSRWDTATSTAYTSAKQTWTLAPASLRGVIYYWTTSAGGQMARIQPGSGWEPLNGGACMGCHAVSSDGSTLVAVWEGQPTNDGSGDNRAWAAFDLPSMNLRTLSTFFGGNVAVNNDGKYVVFGDQTLKLGDTFTGLEIPNSGLEALPLAGGSVGIMTPAFSPNGAHLAAVEGNGSWYHNLEDGGLVHMDFDPATQKFSNLTQLAKAADYPASQRALAYPSYSPDAKWIAFHIGDYATGCDQQGCDDNATQIGTIALQSTSGTPAVDLTALAHGPPNPADDNRAFEPTFNPIERGGYFWVVFTSMRDYGHRVTGTPNNGKKRLWVAAIDKDPSAAPDPSHPAFFLEGQDENTTNMRGFWALSACIPTQGGGGCQAGFECCSGFCDQGECVTPQEFSCVGVGEVCTAASDCCNNSVVLCDEGKCTPQTPD